MVGLLEFELSVSQSDAAWLHHVDLILLTNDVTVYCKCKTTLRAYSIFQYMLNYRLLLYVLFCNVKTGESVTLLVVTYMWFTYSKLIHQWRAAHDKCVNSSVRATEQGFTFFV